MFLSRASALSRALMAATPLAAATAAVVRSSSVAAPSAEHYDYLVIGGGSGGVSSARRAAMYGRKVAIVERGAEWDANGVREGAGFGGTCVNMGCVPKKLMFTAAGHLEAARESAGYGVLHAAASPRLDWAALVERRDAYIARLNTIYEKNLDNSKIERVKGVASFVGPREVSVATAAGDRVISADHVLIAVGGAPTLPAILGAEHVISSDGFFDLKARPKKALVVGSGYIGVEIAGILNVSRRSGAGAHPDRRPRALARLDPDPPPHPPTPPPTRASPASPLPDPPRPR